MEWKKQKYLQGFNKFNLGINMYYNSKLINKWSSLLAGTIILMSLGVLYAWSIFRVPLGEIYSEWTISNLSMAFTISMISFCVGGFTGGVLNKKFNGSKIILYSAGLLISLGFLLLSRLNEKNWEKSLVQLYLYYGVMCGFGVGVGYNFVISTVTKWFEERTGFASGILLMGFGSGGIFLGTGIDHIIEEKGVLSSFFALSVVIFVVIAVCSLFIGQSIKEKIAIKKNNADTKSSLDIDYSPCEMIKKKSFYLFFLWAITISSSGLLVINNAAGIASSFGLISTAGLLVSLFNGFGRMLFGTLYDRYGRETTMLINNIFLLGASTLLLIGAAANSAVLIALGMVVTGVSYGGAPTVSAAVMSEFYGRKYYSINFSIANFSLIPASIIGPLISSSLIEKSNGLFNTTFMMMAFFSILAFVLNWFVGTCRKKELLSISSEKCK